MKDLASLKYSELQKLAKKLGIKANIKRDKLLQILIEHEEKEEKENEPAAVEELVEEKKGRSRNGSGKSKKKQTESEAEESASETESKPAKAKPVTPKLAVKEMAKVKARTPVTPRSPVIFSPQRKVIGKPIIHSPAVSQKLTPVHKTKAATPLSSRVKSGPKPVTPRLGTPKTTASASKLVRNSTPRVRTSTGKRKHSDVMKTPQQEGPQSKKRRSTFDKVPTPELEAMKAAALKSEKKMLSSHQEVPQTRKRRSTFDMVSTPELDVAKKSGEKTSTMQGKKVSSPGVTDMLDAMKPEMSSDEMKQSLMSAIDKKVQDKCKTIESAQSTKSIPRFMALLEKRKEQKKPVTPGNKYWTKIHKKQFEKFDSIDVYLDKKRKRAEEITTSVKKARKMLEEVHTAVDKLKAHKTPEGIITEKKEKKARPSYPTKTSPFKPVLNVKNINFNFGAPKSPKSLPRKSPKSILGSVAKKQTTTINRPLSARKSIGTPCTATLKSGTTPFKFTGTTLNNTTVCEASARKKFDLQASLARPITWKPHTGKLKPLDKNNASPAFKRPAKTVSKSRDIRRENHTKRRADAKQNARMARRGLNV